MTPRARTPSRPTAPRTPRRVGTTATEADEKYGLDWHGKRRARQSAFTPPATTLLPCPEQSVDWETTRNVVIEGDNLEALKLLRAGFARKVKLIYIDPPYNTGKSLVYADDFSDGIRSYLKRTGRAEDGLRGGDAETFGRFHTDWLNMMYPRLSVARELLEARGILLVSIGDEELHNLRSICDELFGPQNYCGMFVWEKKKKPSFLDPNMGAVTEYVIAYARDRAHSPPFVAGAVEDGKKYPFNNAGNPLGVLRFPAGSVRFGCGDRRIRAQDMSRGNIKTRLLDDVTIAQGVNQNPFRLEGEWRYSQATLDGFVADGAELLISKVPFRPNYVHRRNASKKTSNLLSYRTNGVPTNEDATAEMRALFGADVMSYPKPTGLLKYLVRAITVDGDTIVDFFAGSGTTGVGVMLQNLEDQGTRRFILVQRPETLDARDPRQKAAAEFCRRIGKPANIAELTKERLRRESLRLRGLHPHAHADLGFRAFQLVTPASRDPRRTQELT